MARRMYDLAGEDPGRRFSPYCWRIRMALAHKGLAVETIPWRFSDKAAVEFSGQGLVPVLVDEDGTVVSDSFRIAEYLEDRYPDRPSLFGGAGGRAAARFIANWTEFVLHAGIARSVVRDILDVIQPADRAYFRQSREARFGMTLEQVVAGRDAGLAAFQKEMHPLRLTLRTQPFLGGQAADFSDYIVLGAFQWARCVSPFRLLAPDDPVYAWRGRMLGLFDGLAGKSLGYEV